ncbi:hypothetical protein BLX24_26960 [Arsenicibacter rosenii]|uniref:Uncharacterized protein n=2 Tax=Arsenicibacter rosenii TaxID=1750698 RepID=A0A1S2VC85_9BACT|nr:hypothetical protein BLX24_26960 [Arsenicibacter rosenii]
MLDDTLTLFRENESSAISSAQGVMMIDGWLQALDKDANLGHIKDGLTALRNHLNAGHPDPGKVRELMGQLANQVEDVAQGPYSQGQWTGGLQSMAQIIRQFGNSL